ncbi:MAG: site-specific integrase [Lachnospiraceae bacterium]|nr:site-specific integrase [Lachnospiraceae bacterium]
MWIEELDNGRFKFVERYDDYLTGKQKKVSVTLDKNTAATRKFAQAELLKKIGAKQQSVYHDQDITLKDLFDRYCKYQSSEVKQSTARRNSISNGMMLKYLGPDILVNNLTALYVNDCFAKYSVGKQKTVEYVKRFKSMLRWGYNNDLHTNYAIITKLSANNEISAHQKVKDKYLEPEELSELLECLKSTPNYYYLTYFLSLTGLRIGEALALNISDVGPEYIKVNKTYNCNFKSIGTPKTIESNREVYIQPELKELITRIKIYEREMRMEKNIKSLLFFCNKDGHALHYDAYRHYLAKAAEKINLQKKITPHIFRHTHASILAAQSVSIDAISRRLGHSGSKVTKEIYLHITNQLKANDEAQLNNVKFL